MIKRINKKALIFFSVGLLFIIIGIILSSTKSLESNSEEDNETGEEISIDSYEVNNSYDNLKKLRIFEIELYNENGFNIKEISEDSLLSTLLYQIPSEKIGYCGSFMNESNEPIEIDSLNRWLSEVIVDKEITIDYLNTKANFYEPAYNANITLINKRSSEFEVSEFLGIKDEKIYAGSNMCENNVEKQILHDRINKAEISDDLLYLYITRAFYLINGDKVQYYKDPSLTNNIETIDANISYNQEGTIESFEQNIELKWKEYNNYKLTFKMVDGNFHLIKTKLQK